MHARRRRASAYSAQAFPQPGHTSRSSSHGAARPGDPAALSDRQLTDRLIGPLVKCARSGVDPDAWFPVARSAERARAQAADALAVCVQCPLRPECLEVSMRRWATIGRHGIWGGFVEAERGDLHSAWQAGIPVTAFLRPGSRNEEQHPPLQPGATRQPTAAA